jgi:hypothetical protein
MRRTLQKVNSGILSTTQYVQYNTLTWSDGVPIVLLLTIAMPKSPNQKSPQLSRTADIANDDVFLNLEEMHTKMLIKVVNPVRPIQTINTIKMAEPKRLPTWPSLSSTVNCALVSDVCELVHRDLQGNS